MANLSNGSEWQKIYDQFHVAQAIPDQTGRHYPILPVVVPTTIDNYTVAISCITTQFKPTWRFGGKVYPYININNSDISGGKYQNYYPIEINETTMFKIAKLSTYYKLIVELPRWFVNAHLEVWVFTGQDSLINLEEKVDQIQTDLTRIESIFDSIEIYGNQ